MRSFSSRLNNFEQRRRELDRSLEETSVRERELRHELVTLDAQATAAAAEMASRREEMLASTLGRSRVWPNAPAARGRSFKSVNARCTKHSSPRPTKT